MGKWRKAYVSKQQIDRAKQMRGDMPKAEVVLWNRLRRNQHGFRFRRQHPIGPYFADFACLSAKVVVELDGSSHDDRVTHDDCRDIFMRHQGWRVLRFWNMDVLNFPDDVVADILRCCDPGAPS